MTDIGMELLSSTIIVQASKDYRKSLKALKRNAMNRNAKMDKDEVERFFRSTWFEMLTTLDGERLIYMLQEEMSYDG